MVDGGIDINGRQVRCELSSIPICKGGKNRDPKQDFDALPGKVYELDRHPGGVYVLAEATAFVDHPMHR